MGHEKWKRIEPNGTRSEEQSKEEPKARERLDWTGMDWTTGQPVWPQVVAEVASEDKEQPSPTKDAQSDDNEEEKCEAGQDLLNQLLEEKETEAKELVEQTEKLSIDEEE